MRKFTVIFLGINLSLMSFLVFNNLNLREKNSNLIRENTARVELQANTEAITMMQKDRIDVLTQNLSDKEKQTQEYWNHQFQSLVNKQFELLGNLHSN